MSESSDVSSHKDFLFFTVSQFTLCVPVVQPKKKSFFRFWASKVFESVVYHFLMSDFLMCVPHNANEKLLRINIISLNYLVFFSLLYVIKRMAHLISVDVFHAFICAWISCVKICFSEERNSKKKRSVSQNISRYKSKKILKSLSSFFAFPLPFFGFSFSSSITYLSYLHIFSRSANCLAFPVLRA